MKIKKGDLVKMTDKEGRFVQTFEPMKVVEVQGHECILSGQIRVQNKFIEAVIEKLRCSFCGKNQDEVKKLVAGPGVYICNECVIVCIEMTEPEKAELIKAESPPLRTKRKTKKLKNDE